MRGEVVRFPTGQVQNWVAIERGLREVLAEAGSPPEMIAAVCARMRPVYDQLRFSYEAQVRLPLPERATEAENRATREAIGAALADLERRIHDFAQRALLERLKVEVELYVARHGSVPRA